MAIIPAIIGAIIGAILGLIAELALPWSEIIMQQVNDVLANPSISNYPGLSPLISALGILTAYVLLPSVGGAAGFGIGVKMS
jgi:hypothetical protein